jgi:hypothetical protein
LITQASEHATLIRRPRPAIVLAVWRFTIAVETSGAVRSRSSVVRLAGAVGGVASGVAGAQREAAESCSEGDGSRAAAPST